MRCLDKKRRALLFGGALVAVTLFCVLALPRLLAGTAVPGAPSETLLAAAEGLDQIVIEAVLDPEAAAISVWQRLTLTNRAGESRDAAVLRTWPNAFQSPETSPCASEELYDACYPDGFSSGSLVMDEALVARQGAEGVGVDYRYTDEAKTVLLVPVAGGWQPGETIELTLRYTVNVPRTAYRFGVRDHIWALGNCFATPAVWEDGAYRTDAYTAVGDPFISDCANYTVSVSVPRGYLCAGSGCPEEETVQGRAVYRFAAPAVRDFALVISNRFKVAQTMRNGVLVSAYATGRSRAREMLGYAGRALECYTERYGEYPYQSLTLAEIEFPMGGMEYPAMAMIGASQLDAGGRTLEYVMAHEVAHQWWYAVVGSDGVNQSWQDEALCEFSLLDYVETVYGRAQRDELQRTRVESAMRVTVPRGITPGAPLTYFSSMSEYSLVVYNRGAAMLCALDQAMGGTLDDFLRAYYGRYAFSRASRRDFENLLAQHTGGDYGPLIVDYLDTSILN